MTTLHERMGSNPDKNERPMQRTGGEKVVGDMKIPASDRREHRRHDLEQQGIVVDRFDNHRRVERNFGQIVDISAGGVKIRAEGAKNVKPDGQIRIRLELPDYAGISPFIDNSGADLEPKREWVGWMAIARVDQDGDTTEIGGRLVEMNDIDRGMLKLYLSTMPLAA